MNLYANLKVVYPLWTTNLSTVNELLKSDLRNYIQTKLSVKIFKIQVQ